MRFQVLLIGLCALGLLPPASAAEDTSAPVTWYRDDGTASWTTDLSLPLEGDASPLDVTPWYPQLPPVIAEGIDGERIDLAGFHGKVLIVDFWASWCTPCARQLPALQTLYDTRHDRGLEVVTVNADETDDIARRFAGARNITLPIARFTPDMREAFQVGGLPTVYVADRAGNVRSRLTAGGPGTKEALEQLVDELLDESPDRGVEVARVHRGAGALGVRWSRTIDATVLGLAVLERSDPPESRVLAATGREIVGLGAKGKEWMTRQVGPGVDRLRTAEGGSDGAMPLCGFRPAGERVIRISLESEEVTGFDAPSRVLDLSIEPVRFDAPRSMLLATVDGLWRVGLDGAPLGRREDLGLIADVVRTDAGTVILDGEGKLRRLDHDLKTVAEWEAGTTSRVLVAARGLAPGVGVASPAVRDAATGRFLDGEGAQVALALEDRLILLDLETGNPVVLATWPRIEALAAADLDDDGRTELFVGSGKRVTVLSSR